MGLTINKYSRSYSTLHILRQIVLEIEGSGYTLEDVYNGAPTSFHEFIVHSDCEGGYISFSFFGIEDLSGISKHYKRFGNLDKLKEEMKQIKEILYDVENVSSYNIRSMEAFIEDVEDAQYVLEFR